MKKNRRKYLAEKFFDRRYAKEYDKWLESPWLAHLEKRQKLLTVRLLNLSRGEKILDVGCGTGKYLVEIGKFGNSLVGVDFSREMLKVTKEKINCLKSGKIKLVLADVLHLPFKDKAFDKSFTMNTLQYLDDDVKCIKEMKRVTRKKLILDGICKSELRLVYPMFCFLNKIRSFLGLKQRGIYKNYYSVASLQKKVIASGLKFGKAFGCGLTLPYFSQEIFGVKLPSPFHLTQIFSQFYKLAEKIEEKFGDKFPFNHLGTHIIAEVLVKSKK